MFFRRETSTPPLRIAAIAITLWMRENKIKKFDIEAIKSEIGLAKFMPSSVVQTFNPKALAEGLDQWVKNTMVREAK